MKAKQIKEIAAQYADCDYDYIGIRIQEDAFGLSVGDVVDHVSRNFGGDFDGTELDGEMLSGVSAIDVSEARYLDSRTEYGGDVALVLGCNSAEGGYDQGEIIMRKPVVLAIVIDEEMK